MLQWWFVWHKEITDFQGWKVLKAAITHHSSAISVHGCSSNVTRKETCIKKDTPCFYTCKFFYIAMVHLHIQQKESSPCGFYSGLTISVIYASFSLWEMLKLNENDWVFFKGWLICIWCKSKERQVCCNILKHSGSMLAGQLVEVKIWQGQAGDWAMGALPGAGSDREPNNSKRSATSVWGAKHL